MPGVFTQSLNFLSPEEIGYQHRLGADKTMINVGSVGQPRDGDPRACYVVIEDDMGTVHDASLVQLFRTKLDTEEGVIITAHPIASGTYGDPLTDLALIGGSANVAGVFTWDEPDPGKVYPTAVDTASYKVKFTPENQEFPAITDIMVSPSINRKRVMAVVDTAVKLYGQPNPLFTAKCEELVGADDISVLNLTLKSAATETSEVGNYDVTSATGLGENGNYHVTLDGSGKLSIISAADKTRLEELLSKAALMVEADYPALLWTQFIATLSEAKSVHANVSATQLEVAYAVHSLDEIMDVLVKTLSIQINLTSDAQHVVKGGYFKVNASFKDIVNGNAAILKVKYDTSLFRYSGCTAKDGVSVLTTEETENGVNITIMIQDYSAGDLLDLSFYAKEDADLAANKSLIIVDTDIVIRSEDGSKKILSSTGELSITVNHAVEGDVNGDGLVDLIDLSDIIDAFGITSAPRNWATQYKHMDFNGNGSIDISDITYVAQLIIYI